MKEKISSTKKPLEKFPKPKAINIIINKETYLDNYYSKDFVKKYFT